MICLVWAILSGILGFVAGSCYLAWYLDRHPEAWLGEELATVMTQYQAIQAIQKYGDQEQVEALIQEIRDDPHWR